jgi:exodeoxyribonuclease V alpha subunit
VTRGPGPLRLRLAAVNRAREELARWSVKWQSYRPDMPTGNDQVVYYAHDSDNRTRLSHAFNAHAQQQAAAAHPGHAALVATAQAARTQRDHAFRELGDVGRRHTEQLRQYGSLGYTPNLDIQLARAEYDVTTTRTALAKVQQEISRLSAEPAIRALPTGRLTHEHDLWRSGYQTERELARQAAIRYARRVNIERTQRLGLSAYGLPAYGCDRQHQRPVGFDPEPGPSIGR